MSALASPAIGQEQEADTPRSTEERSSSAGFATSASNTVKPEVLVASTVEDDFDDNLLNPNLWKEFKAADWTIAEQNQRLEIDAGPGIGSAGVENVCEVIGNFDAVVDFELLEWPVANPYGLLISVGDISEGLREVQLQRNSSSESGVESYIFVSSEGTSQIVTGHLTGSLRLNRKDDRITGYFLDGDSWVEVGSGPVASQSLHISLSLGSNSSDALGNALVGFDNLKVTADTLQCLTSTPAVATVFDYPVGFGECAEHPLSEYRVEQGADFLDEDYFQLFGRHHSGEDWNRGGGTTDLGDPVCSIADGVVVESANFGGGWGNIVVVEHVLPGGSSVWSQYAHLEERSVQRLDVVERGDRIGTIGEGCNADRSRCDYSGISHLHFEIRRVDVPADNPPGSSVEDAERIHDEYFDPTDIPTDSHPDKGFIEGNRFHDTSNSIFFSDIGWLSDRGITKGCNPPKNTHYCPDDFVTRGQMAAFLVRALGYADDGGGNLFIDDDDSIFESDIDKLGTAGVTKGCNPPENDRYCPEDFVTRGQMAAFLVRAMGYTDDGGGDLFVDDDGSTFENDIDKLGTAGVTKGCNPPVNDRFCPDELVNRGQMAAFLHRALGP